MPAVCAHRDKYRASFLLSTSSVRGLSGKASDVFSLLVLPVAAPVTSPTSSDALDLFFRILLLADADAWLR